MHVFNGRGYLSFRVPILRRYLLFWSLRIPCTRSRQVVSKYKYSFDTVHCIATRVQLQFCTLWPWPVAFPQVHYNVTAAPVQNSKVQNTAKCKTAECKTAKCKIAKYKTVKCMIAKCKTLQSTKTLQCAKHCNCAMSCSLNNSIPLEHNASTV